MSNESNQEFFNFDFVNGDGEPIFVGDTYYPSVVYPSIKSAKKEDQPTLVREEIYFDEDGVVEKIIREYG